MAKLHFSRQRYYFFRIYASAKRIFLIKSHISSLFLHLIPFSSPFVCHLLATYLHRNLIGISSEPHWNLIGTSPNDERVIKQLLPRLKQLSFDMIFPYTLHKKSHSPCAYAIFLLPLRSNLLHHIYYENNHHYPSSNYGTQILSSLWCCIYLSARESRQVPMCRCGTLSLCSCTSGSAIP